MTLLAVTKGNFGTHAIRHSKKHLILYCPETNLLVADRLDRPKVANFFYIKDFAHLHQISNAGKEMAQGVKMLQTRAVDKDKSMIKANKELTTALSKVKSKNASRLKKVQEEADAREEKRRVDEGRLILTFYLHH